MKSCLFLVILGIYIGINPIYAQRKPVDSEIQKSVQLAKKEMDAGNYQKANAIFRSILDKNEVLPANMCYYFAETLYMVEQYQNSKSFTDKYIKLTGKGGDFYEQAIDLQNLLAVKFNEITSCGFCDTKGYRLVICSRCLGERVLNSDCPYCRGHGFTTCRRCLGEGILIEKDALNHPEYRTCPLCDGKGYETCIVCHGAKYLEQSCPVCIGSGVEPSKEICDHQNHYVNEKIR